MYEQFFGLSEKPFSILPDPSFLYWGRTHRLAYAMLEYGVLNHAGISVITGEIGCGKTTLIHRLLDQLSDTHTVALLSNVQQGRGDLLSWVLMGFGEPFSGKSHVELFAQLQNFFVSEYAKGRRVVLVIDEAQNLSTDMLEELRMLSNINAGKDQLLQLILVGQPELKGLLNRPELLQLAQRIGADFHLTPLNREEVHAYIETRLSIAGCRRRIFTDRAMDFVSEQSKGVPRVINIIADTALVYAFSAEELVVGVETIRNVVRDKTEFGVFGLASDEDVAPPLKPDSKSPINVFADASTADKPKAKKSIEKDGPSKGSKEAAINTASEAKAPQPDDVPAHDRTIVEDAQEVEKLTASIAEQPAAPPEKDPVQVKVSPKEESAITGVVIIAQDETKSPEAAVASAGDGRAIVFVSDAKAGECREIARNSGAVITEIAESAAVTAGRLRNAGYRQLKQIAPHIEFVQFLDADQVLPSEWISTGEKFLQRRPEVAMVEGDVDRRGGHYGRPREEDETELAYITGAAALVRASSFEDVGGFRGDLLAANMADLSVRLRRRGGRIWHLPNIMTHEEPLSESFADWWGSAKKRGFENAYGASLHGAPPERLGVGNTLAAVAVTVGLPLLFLFTALASIIIIPTIAPSANLFIILLAIMVLAVPFFLGCLLIIGVMGAMKKWRGIRPAMASVAARVPEFLGACRFWLGKKAIHRT